MSQTSTSYDPQEWLSFAAHAMRRGVMPQEVRAAMRRAGLTEEQMREALGPAADGVISPDEVDYEAICNCRLTQIADSHPDITRVPTSKAQVYIWDNFLPANACEAVIALTEEGWRQSTVTDAFADPKIRTSKTADIGLLGHPLIFKIDERMAQYLGIHWSYADGTQAQRYLPGQEYKAHQDWFMPGTRDYQVECQDRGQRTWTFMVYLNDVEEGGGTRFRRLEKTFMPKQGRAVIWNNLNRDGSVNHHVLHHGTKVKSGVKYVITKWFRERGFGPMAYGPPSSPSA